MNIVFIAQSIDGYIADKEGKIDWLTSVPNPEGNDMGYTSHIERIDAIVMGRKTFETILSFNIDWPYTKPVFVLSQTLASLPPDLKGKVEIINDCPRKITESLNNKGYENLYIDGGSTIQSFIKDKLIDEMIITTIPIVLGDGYPLFGKQSFSQNFNCTSSKVYLNKIVQTHYIKTQG